jgi:hypothetical protein
MHFFSLFITTMALAVSTVYALPQDTDGPTCLRLCRDEPLTTCPSGWESAQIASEEQDGQVRTLYLLQNRTVLC